MREAIEAASQHQPLPVSDNCKTEIASFVSRRLEQFLIDSGLSPEVVRATLQERELDPVLIQQSAKDLQVGDSGHISSEKIDIWSLQTKAEET